MAGDGIRVHVYGDYDDRDINRAIKHLNTLRKDGDATSSGISTAAKKIGVAFAAIGAAVAVKEVVDFGKAAIEAGQESVVAAARMDSIAKSMGLTEGAYAGGTDRLREYASALSAQIGVEDESINAVQAKLMTFKALGDTINQTGGSLDRATQAAYDLASAGFGSAESNATQLGKALQDPVKGLTALARSGVTFTEAEKAKIAALVESGNLLDAQNVVLSAIETQVGGTAAATATATDRMKVAWGEVQESVGVALLPVINNIAETLIPIFQDLQEPLGKIAETVGGALAQAFEAIRPVLPVLATAFAQIAGTLGGALAQALSAIMPALTPLIQMFADFAQRLGPLLAPLIQKIGDLFSRLLSALMPLLQPLMELMFTIFEAAMPILEIIADLFLMVADALAPVFEIVGALLKPLGDLIRVGFQAIEPVLRPLMPVFESLASILGDVLVRAIGFLMTAFGALIKAWSKVAPFVLDFLIKPIVDGFLAFAETIVGAAASAFSWVPGLGDKLAGAKSAIEDFRSKATDAIGKAADTIESEGTKIGDGLIDEGVKAMSSPTNMSKLNRAGYNSGGVLVDGMAYGMTSESSQRTLVRASTQVIMTADGAARRAAEAQSPSRLFARVGMDLIDGLVQGLEAGKGKLSEKGKTVIDEAFAKWKTAVDEAKSLGQEITDNLFGNLNIDEALTKAKETGGSIVDAFVAQSNRAQEFGAKMQRLLEAGLNPHVWQQIAGMSMDRGTEIADAYLNGNTAEMVRRTNDAVTSAQNVANAVGRNASIAFSAAGLKAATDFLEAAIREFLPNGAKRKKLLGLIDDLIAAMSKTATVSVNAVINGTPIASFTGSTGGGGGSAPAPAPTPAAPSPTGDWVGAAATAAIGAQFDAQTLANAQALNAAAPYGTDAILALGFTAAEWEALKALEAANNAAAGLARGGWARANVPYWVGERGPELVTFDRPSYVNSARRSQQMAGPTYNITIQSGLGDPRAIGKAVVEAITRFEQSNGPIYAKAS